MGKLLRKSIALALLLAPASQLQAGYDRRVPVDYVPGLMRMSPERYFQEINSGWQPGLYSSLKSKLAPGRSYLVIHNRLPSTTLDLRSANGFRASVKNLGLLKMQQLDIGHVMLGWRCEIDGRIYEGNTSITGEQDSQQRKMASDGWGLTGLFSIFLDGHLQTPLLQASVYRTHAKSQFATTAFEIEPEQCGRMLSFIRDFLEAPSEPWRRFGLNADPLKFEGGGCGSFAASVAYATGAIDDIFPYFWRELHVNPRTLGYGLPGLPDKIELFSFDKRFGPSFKVNQLKAMFLMDWNGGKSDPHTRLMDPEMLYLFQRTVHRQSLDDVYRYSGTAMGRRLIASPYTKARILQENRREGVVDVKVDETFDHTSAQVVNTTKRWFSSLKSRGYKAVGFDFMGQPAVLLTR